MVVNERKSLTVQASHPQKGLKNSPIANPQLFWQVQNPQRHNQRKIQKM